MLTSSPLIRWEVRREWGALLVSRAHGQVPLICWGWGRADGAALRGLSAVSKADSPRSRQRKPFVLELAAAESEAALDLGLRCVLCV